MESGNLKISIADKQAQFFGNLYSLLPNPNLVIAQAGDKKVTFQNIMNDPHVASCVQTRKSGVKGYAYEVQGEDESVVEFCNSVLKQIDVSQFINNVLDAIFWGYNVFEVTWWYDFINDTDSIVPNRVVPKPIDWFIFDHNNICRFVSNENTEGKILPPKKFIIVQHDANYLNPYGDPILSKCLWSVVFKKTDITFWLKFVEKFGMPHFVGKTGSSANSEQYDEFVEQLDKLVQDASTVIDSMDDITAINGATSINANLYKDLAEFCNTEISKAILSQTLTTEINGVGTYAAGKVHYDVLGSVIDADKKLVEKAVNQLLGWAVELNFPDAEAPNFIMFPKEDVDKPLAEVTDMLTKNGQIRFTKKFYETRFGFAEDEFEIIETAPATPVATKPTTKFNFAETVPADQIMIDSFVDKSVSTSDELFTNLANQITKLLNKFSSFDEAKANIHTLLPNLDTADIEQKLLNVLFLADTLGRISVNEELSNG